MQKDGEPYGRLNSHWKSTCRIIFGEEIGELDGFRPYLLEHHYPCAGAKSSLSGKEVALSSSRYCDGARIISQDEADFERKFAPFSINELKDIDSVLSALQERFRYCGNKTFGNSKFAEGSDNCDSSYHVLDSHTVISSEYVAYSSFVRAKSSYVFGGVALMNSSHIIRGSGANCSRNFESYQCFDCSDLFWAYYCFGCMHCMFSFNLHSRNYAIGNLVLGKEEYFKLRNKLTAEVCEILEKDKRFRPIWDFAAPAKNEIGAVGMPRFAKEPVDTSRLEDAFRKTTCLVLGKELVGVKKYEKFLAVHTPKILCLKSAFGNECDYSDYFVGKNVHEDRAVSAEEALIAGQKCIDVKPQEGIGKILQKASRIAFFSTETLAGENGNNAEAPIQYNARDNYRVAVAAYSSRSAYSAHLQDCEAVFGSGMLTLGSSFCIRCHNCVKVTCSMDMDSCSNCARSMFCHNCENVNDSIFCFNTKNKNYAVGNVGVGREEYLRVRKLVNEEILRQLREDGSIKLDICSLGCLPIKTLESNSPKSTHP